MILSKGLLQTKNTFLASVKLYKVSIFPLFNAQQICKKISHAVILQFHSSHFHALHSPIAQYRQINVAVEPLIWNVLSRLESSQAAVAKDTILNLPNPNKTGVAPVVDGLPDIPVPGTASSATEALTTSTSQLPDIIAEAIIPLVSFFYKL